MSAAPTYIPTSTSTPQLERSQYTDVVNAARLVERHGDKLRYVRGWEWLVYDGTRWVRDETGQVMELAKETVNHMFFEAAALHADGKGQDALALWKHAHASERDDRLNAMVRLARSDKAIRATPDDFDQDPLLLNVQNGTLDLRTGELRKHDPDDKLTHLCPVDYVADATSPRWEAFVLETADYDMDLADYLQCAAGYSLTGLTGEKAFFLCYGPGGNNGKSTFLEALRYVLGDYAAILPPESLMTGASSGIRNDLAALPGKRFVVSNEPEDGQKLAMGMLKSFTGNDTMSVRYLHKEFFDFRPQAKLWLAANSRPSMSEAGRAALGRMRLVPFDHTPEVLDKTLGAQFQQEANAQAILAWAVKGFLRYQDSGLPEVARMTEAANDYAGDQAPFSLFLTECTEPGEYEESKLVHSAYAAWQRKQRSMGEEAPVLSQTALNKEAEKHGHKKGRTNGKSVLRGLKLKQGVAHADPDDDIPF